jgi:uncharacterized protein
MIWVVTPRKKTGFLNRKGDIKMFWQKNWIIPLSGFIIILLCGVLAPAAAQTPSAKIPEIITMTAYDVGSTGYIQAAAIADALTKKMGVKFRILPAGNDVARTLPLKNRTVQFSMAGVGAYYFAGEGIEDFARMDWGPQRIQAVWNCFQVGGSSLVTAKNAGIKTPADMKGKKMYWVPGAPALTITNTAFLAFANLTWNDVKRVDYPSYTAALRGMVEGTCDMGFTSATAAINYELESSRRGIWWPEFPPSDVEGWKRLQAVAPYMVPMRNYGGPGQPPEGVQTMTYSYPMLITYDWQDEELVYLFTKGIDENFLLYKDAFSAMPTWERSKAIVPGLPNPFHKGAVRYFKEIGLWNQKFEESQKKTLERQNKLAKAWESALAEAKAKGLKEDDFPAFWKKKHAELGK